MVNQRVDWEVLLIAGVMTAAVMSGMYFLGQELNDQKQATITADVTALTVETNSQDLSRRLAQNLQTRNCKALNAAVQETISAVGDLEDSVETYENNQKLGGDTFTLLKERYTNLLLEYWLTTRQIEDQCGSSVVKVLYIYADQPRCMRCADQGTVLTKYRQQYNDQLLVFPLDADLGLSPVNVLIDAYDIEQYPALIIQGDVYEGYRDHDELDTILSGYMTNITTNSTQRTS